MGGDDELIGSMATEHLVEIGCRTIAHVGGSKVSPARGRLEGYKKTLAKHHMSPGPNYIAVGESSIIALTKRATNRRRNC